jgi:hypothetical protein
MTRKEMEQRLSKYIRQGTCWNDVAFQFVEDILVEHLGIDPNSIDPTSARNKEIINNPLLHNKPFEYINTSDIPYGRGHKRGE